jgi:hypothetical protein
VCIVKANIGTGCFGEQYADACPYGRLYAFKKTIIISIGIRLEIGKYNTAEKF